MKKRIFLVLIIAFCSIKANAYDGITNLPKDKLIGVFKQLMTDEKVFVKGSPSEYIAVKSVDLNDDGIPEYIVEGINSPFFGARSAMYWIYKNSGEGYKRIADLGACDGVEVLRTKHNKYKDINIGEVKYIYNGKAYGRK